MQLYKDLVGLDFMYGTEENIIEACDIALNSLMLPEDVKFQISQRKLEYLEDFGLDARRYCPFSIVMFILITYYYPMLYQDPEDIR